MGDGGGQDTALESHSLRSAWIEINLDSVPYLTPESHSLRSAWIEISKNVKTLRVAAGRTPYGVRG